MIRVFLCFINAAEDKFSRASQRAKVSYTELSWPAEPPEQRGEREERVVVRNPIPQSAIIY